MIQWFVFLTKPAACMEGETSPALACVTASATSCGVRRGKENVNTLPIGHRSSYLANFRLVRNCGVYRPSYSPVSYPHSI